MPAARSRSDLVGALHDTFDPILALGRELSDAEWATPSECPGWTVKDCFSHMLGTECQIFLHRPAPEVDIGASPHLRNDIARFNEVWVEAYRSRSAAELMADLAEAVAARYAQLDVMSQEDFDVVGFTPAGQDSLGRFLQIRVFDCWIHEHDVRGPLARPGHASGPAVEVALDELTNSLGFVFGKKAGATEGQTLTLDLTGDAARTIHVVVEGRARVVPALTTPATVTVTVPTLRWFRLAAGRAVGDPDDPDVTISGDADLGRRLLRNAAYTI